MQRHSPDRPYSHTRFYLFFLALLWAFPGTLLAQSPAGAGAGARAANLPDAPQPKDNASGNPVETGTSKVLGYLTNRSIFFPDIATSAGPLSTAGKFKQFVNESISPAYVLQSGIAASYGQAVNWPKFGQGWDSYAERFGVSMARDSSNSFFSSFVFASAFHQDPRFFPQLHPSLWGSVKYSARRLFVTQTDSGNDTFNSSGLLGPAASEILAMSYLPTNQHKTGATLERYGTDLAWRFAGNMFKNYWPVFFHDLGLNKLKVIPDPAPSTAAHQ
jgi:hypothetical protein